MRGEEVGPRAKRRLGGSNTSVRDNRLRFHANEHMTPVDGSGSGPKTNRVNALTLLQASFRWSDTIRWALKYWDDMIADQRISRG